MFLFTQKSYFFSGTNYLVNSNGALATIIYFLHDLAEVWIINSCKDGEGTAAATAKKKSLVGRTQDLSYGCHSLVKMNIPQDTQKSYYDKGDSYGTLYFYATI